MSAPAPSAPNRPAARNRLAGETSPYLQQHAGNPVDWYPWCEEALARSRSEDKPILLSIGYSACHWCHVMAHESFEDPEVAAVLNRLFINIKVDREERPDLDQIYQLAHQMLSQRPGGWPLTVFLTPDQVPFYAGTYFPKDARHNLPGFPELAERIAQAYREQRPAIEEQNASLRAALQGVQHRAGASDAEFSREPLDDAIRGLESSFDPRHGGFGGAPKFPHPMELQLCLRRFADSGEEQALKMVSVTLERMALGGIYDQLGGGFARYSVDASWTIPHFEKMLYDNGPLLRLYSDAWTVTRNPVFARIVEETAAWTMREMQSAQGGYYSSIDADSEHEEGRFYVWTPQQAASLLSAEEYAVIAPYYGLEGPANFEGTHWHLQVTRTLAAVAHRIGRSVEQCEQLLASARKKLFQAREERVRPGRDEKVLTSWNALMIAGMARAGAVFGRDDWIASAERAADFIRASLWQRGRLLATCKDGRAHLNAYLDDYAYCLDALMELVQAKFDVKTLAFAGELAQVLLAQFEDVEQGGFFFTSHDHERLIQRSKPGYDNATPSGNGVAALSLQRLSCLTGEARYARAAERTIALYYPGMREHPGAYSTLMMALEEQLSPPRSVILRGREPGLSAWRRALATECMARTMVLAIPPGMASLPEVLDKPASGEVNAWVCEGVSCLAPIAHLESLRAQVCRPAQSG